MIPTWSTQAVVPPQTTSSFALMNESPWAVLQTYVPCAQGFPVFQQPVIVVQNTNMNYVQQPMMYPMVVPERKNAGLAVVLSWFFPGGGQFYNGEVGQGLIMLFGFWGTIWFGVGLGFWIWSMVDAYNTANKINQGYVVG